MNNTKQERKILSIAPSTNGFGFAFIGESGTLIDCGTKWIQTGNKNKKSLAAITKMIGRFGADVIVLPDASEKGSRRAKRIRKLVQQIASIGIKHDIAVRLISQKELQDHFFGGDEGTKYARAKILAQKFPQELVHRLPPKRKSWLSEDAKICRSIKRKGGWDECARWVATNDPTRTNYPTRFYRVRSQ